MPRMMASSLKVHLSAEWASFPICSNDAWVSGGLGGKGIVEELGVTEGTTLDVPKCLGAELGNTAFAGSV
ncbi:hypothetical protein H5410_055899 [Solanum commersonii]|uniref:Uncharacterized protein n=1 Tax=Solanum commersonii TaxID=4109 RepID=A0A9J5WK46_SOLCO|nr:hypothetical protein H5410_055899 [Solanum commersonii]